MSEEVGIGGTDPRAVRRTRIVIAAFLIAAVLAIVGSLALPMWAMDRVAANCAADGGTYVRETATCEGVAGGGRDEGLDREFDGL